MKDILLTIEGISDKEVEWLINAGERKEVAAGTVLIQEGQPVNTVYIVIEGRLSQTVAGSFGENQEVAIASGGEIVGEMSLLDVRPSSVTALALERCPKRTRFANATASDSPETISGKITAGCGVCFPIVSSDVLRGRASRTLYCSPKDCAEYQRC